MKLLVWFTLAGLLLAGVCMAKKSPQHAADLDDNEFAEFEDFDDEEIDEAVVQDDDADFPDEFDDDEDDEKTHSSTADKTDDDADDEGTVESEDDDFYHFNDEDEFEGFDPESRPGKGKSHDMPDLKIAKVPIHLRTNWDSFYLEMLMLAGLGVYFLNFLTGKTKNNKLAQSWLAAHKEILDSNFSIVGDDGTAKEPSSGTLMKESENVYALWCSGRTCVEGMLVELKLIKRQDLISVMSSFFKPVSDQIVITVHMDAMSMDRFCMLVAHKKVSLKLHKEQNDLSQLTEKKNTDKYGIPSCFSLLSEIGEATSAVLDKKVCQALCKYESQIEYIHMSDQYSGSQTQEEGATKMQEGKSILKFAFNVPGKGKTKPADMESMRPLLQLVFYCVDKVSRLTLSKEARAKADKNRQKAEEDFLKAAHAQRQEQAQLRREEKRRAEKEKMMNEEDPDKARKWEERESKRDLKKKQPKMKLMKV